MRHLLRRWLGIESLAADLQNLPTRAQLVQAKADYAGAMADLTNLGDKVSNALKAIASRQGVRAARSLDAGKTWGTDQPDDHPRLAEFELEDEQLGLSDWDREKTR